MHSACAIKDCYAPFATASVATAVILSFANLLALLTAGQPVCFTPAYACKKKTYLMIGFGISF